MTGIAIRNHLTGIRLAAVLMLTACFALAACKKEEGGTGPVPVQVSQKGDMALFSVENPERYPLVATEEYEVPAELNATGSVFPDIAREIPVISLGSGRVVDIKARLDDYVKKGQLLLKIQSPDSSNAFDVYLKARNDENHE